MTIESSNKMSFTSKRQKELEYIAGWTGIEPVTVGFGVRCSTN
jgi:hypothetical protein